MKRTMIRSTTEALCFSLLLFACNRQNDAPDKEPAVEKIAEQPRSFYGKSVTASGEVKKIHGPYAFELEEGWGLFDKEHVLVISKSPMRFGGSELGDDDFVVVAGTVRKYVQADFEKEFDWDLGSVVVLDDYKEKPVIVADSVRRLSEYGRWSEADEPSGVRVGWMATLIEPEPATLVGEKITLDSVRIIDESGRALWLGSYLYPIMSVQRPDQGVFDVGDWVDVQGHIERLPKDQVSIDAWGVDPKEKHRLDDADFYISIDSIEKTKDLPSRIKSSVTYDAFAKDMKHHGDQLVTGKAKVTKVISDRGFYLENPSGGQDVFAVVREDIPRHEMIDIDRGDTLEFEAWSEQDVDQVEGQLEPDAKRAIEKSPAFLTMYWRNVHIVQG